MESDQQQTLERHISVAEILMAIGSLQNGKAPGPDGFPSDFYKVFANKLAPLLCMVFAEIHATSKLPQTLSQATISVILKKGRDPQKCESYRPISLLNVDYKILTKVLALRLEKIAPSVIHEDQTGFIAGRQSYFNTRHLFNILYSDHSVDVPELIVSLDAEKAFDCVEWRYLLAVLRKFGFGSGFISWIKTLYSMPLSSVRTNSTVSEYFALHRGTRQGCPLSPLLFDFAIEPLAIALRTDKGITGISRGGEVHKTSLYADDLLLYIANPEESIPRMLELLSSFGSLSGYKLNLGKSILFPINQLARDWDYSKFPLTVEKKSFAYLGIKITNNYNTLFRYNFSSLLEKTEADLARWSALPVSLAGRINTIKMAVLPKFMYFFQMIPLFLPKVFFTKLDGLISSFIWNKKCPRIRRSKLQRSKSEGGFGLPNFKYYYWSANIVKLPIWLRTFKENRGPLWSIMELTADLPASPVSFMCASLPITKKMSFRNPVIINTLKIWFQCRRHFGFQRTLVYSPISSNPFFQPALNDFGFKTWQRKGIVLFTDLFVDGSFMSFESICKNFDIPKSHFFRYLQVRSFAGKHFTTYPIQPLPSTLENCLQSQPTTRGQISQIYNQLHHIDPTSLSQLKHSWEQDLNSEIPEEIWNTSITLIHSTSICIRHSLTQFKVFHRSYLTKAKLARIYNSSDDRCPRCNHSPATMSHMFWSCTALDRLWDSVFKTFSYLCGRKIDPNPFTTVFGALPNTEGLNSYQTNAIAFLSLLARRLILVKWKDDRPPSFVQWVREAMMCLQMEYLRYNIQGSTGKYYKMWAPFITYLEGLPFT
uniref:Reverse transcriptase domain-containing protein n=1 Tax=Oryzias sinensis TaxID=183150 RepID=A0A8C7XNT8_9TELE